MENGNTGERKGRPMQTHRSQEKARLKNIIEDV